MAPPTLKALNILLLLVFFAGCAWIAYEILMLYRVWDAARGGNSITIDQVAAATTTALKGLALGVPIATVSLVARVAVTRKLQVVS
jgi:hypothetical protein